MRLTSDLAGLATTRDFRALLAVRLISQTGDGLVQVGLASLFFFQPQNMTTAAGVAAAVVVMLLPFSVVGPLTGPFIDRWRRRQTLVVGNLLRAAIIGATAAALEAVGIGSVVYGLVLVALGINRFLLSVLSAGLPEVVDRDRLLVANSIVPTLGGAAAALGAVIGLCLRVVLPDGAAQDTASLVVAAGLYCLAAVVVLRIGVERLGPDRVDRAVGPAEALAAAVSDLGEAVRYLVARGTPGLALSTMAAHRFAYGMELITMILTARNLMADPRDATTGLAVFGMLMGAMVTGHGVAVVLTPVAHERVRPSTWVVMCLIGGTAGQLLIVVGHEQVPMAVGIFVFGVGVQGAKIAVDTIVQSDTADAFRGRAFSIYDVLFNTAECVAAGVAVLVLPDVGWSRPVQVALVALVWVVALVYRWRVGVLGDRPREVVWARPALMAQPSPCAESDYRAANGVSEASTSRTGRSRRRRTR